ncbi:MAG: hypothetical protein FD155_2156 [Bacteroidetes bacterium]|nr:MAG: hypothetical protein FD155_2156 [Bacteroidota bacterium]
MLAIQFLSHQWKQAKRSSIWQRNLAVNLIMGFFIFILFAEVVILAIYVSDKWHEIITTGEPVSVYHQAVAWYFAGMFTMRFFMQKLPALEIRPYQQLPIKKRHLIHFVLVKGVFNFFSLISMVFFIPFAIFQISYFHGTSTAWIWLLGLLFLDQAINLLVIYVKKQMVTNLKIVVLFFAVLSALALAEYTEWYSFSSTIAGFLDYLLIHPWMFALLPVLALLLYALNFEYLKQGMYLESFQPKSGREDKYLNNQFSVLDRIGLIGELIALELKLQLRNKRTRSMLMLAPLFLGYGFFFYPQEEYGPESGFMIFIGIFVTSILSINYLQYSFSSEGGHFDFFLTLGLRMKDYVSAKLQLSTFLIIASYIITIPYIYFGTTIFFTNTACFLFSLGIINPMILYFATYNKKAMVLTKGSAFNYQGISAMHFFIMIPVFILPIFIYLPFKWFGNPTMGLIVLGALGLFGLLLRPWFIKNIVGNLYERKYIMAEGFRDKS